MVYEESYGINTYKTIPISMSQKDSDALFARLEQKKANHETFSKEDLVELALTPIMGGTLRKGEKIRKSLLLYSRPKYLPTIHFRRGICSYTKHLPAANIKCN